MRFDVVLPWVPSTNSIWRSVPMPGGRSRTIKSRAYREWRDRASEALSLVWKAEPYDGPVSVELRLYGPSRRSYDIDNRIKGVLDVLQGHVLEDDAQVDRIVVRRGEMVKRGAVWVSVEAIQSLPLEFPR
jgi:Holliday junction resolvase RusA-like endonuclease